ncbi:MAG: cytochrome C oxidase subunit IV family protein [Planctomycetota bacterium]
MSSESHHHVTSLPTLFTTFAALVALTFLTSALAVVDLSELELATQFGISGVLARGEIWITLGIATVKAALVALIFMHLRNDKALHGIILLITLAFAVLFIGFALMDTSQYEPQIEQFISDQEQQLVKDNM